MRLCADGESAELCQKVATSYRALREETRLRDGRGHCSPDFQHNNHPLHSSAHPRNNPHNLGLANLYPAGEIPGRDPKATSSLHIQRSNRVSSPIDIEAEANPPLPG